MNQRFFKESNGDISTFTYIPNFLSWSECFIYQIWIYVCIIFHPVFTYGSSIIRYQIWYHKNLEYFNKKWPFYERWEAHKYPLFLHFIENRVKKRVFEITNTALEINSCLINKYSQKTHRLHYHRDCEDVFGKCPIIISVSLGSRAHMHVKRNASLQNDDEFIWILEPGSMLIMSGYSQVYFTHAVKMTNDDSRYSMVFRKHIYL